VKVCDAELSGCSTCLFRPALTSVIVNKSVLPPLLSGCHIVFRNMKQSTEAVFSTYFEFFVKDEYFNGLPLHAIESHCFRRSRRVQYLKVFVQVINIKVDSKFILCGDCEMYCSANSLASKEVSVSPETDCSP
jgi:hypothetical protein